MTLCPLMHASLPKVFLKRFDMKFFIATKNQKKLVELERILKPMGFEVVSVNDLETSFPDVEETGKTFEENALLKARFGCGFTGLPTVADDSGLCVDALDGAPGVYSARFSGEECDDERNNDKLLTLLKDVPYEKRDAHYVSVIACVFPDGRSFTVRGECDGKIAFERQGTNGFGYDPLFITEYGVFGEISAEQKDKVSHRGDSLRKFKEKIVKFI